MPFRVDVELHGPHCSGVLKDLRDADHGLIVSGDVDEVASSVDPHTGAPDASDSAERVSPLGAVGIGVQSGIQLAIPDDRSQALSSPCDAGAGVRAAAPIHNVHAAVRITNE